MLYDTSSLIFLSTLSLRRATFASAGRLQIVYNFYPRSPCGERPHPIGVLITVIEISIHALLAESDFAARHMAVGVNLFLSTLSLRRATAAQATNADVASISIHALLAESDALKQHQAAHRRAFLSTLSLRRATCDGRPQSGWTDISIHALLAESD